MSGAIKARHRDRTSSSADSGNTPSPNPEDRLGQAAGKTSAIGWRVVASRAGQDYSIDWVPLAKRKIVRIHKGRICTCTEE